MRCNYVKQQGRLHYRKRRIEAREAANEAEKRKLTLYKELREAIIIEKLSLSDESVIQRVMHKAINVE